VLTTETRDRSPAELLAVVADALPAALAYIDAGERYRYVNRCYTERFAEFGGQVGASVRDGLSAEQYARLRPHIARALAGESVTFETELRHSGGESLWLSVTYVPDFDLERRVRGYAALLEDITGRRRLEDGQRALAESGRVLASSLDYQETLERTARLAVPRYGDWCFIDLLAEDGAHFDRVAGASRDPERADLVRALLRRYPLAPELDLGVARVIADATSVLVKTGDRAYWHSLARDDQHRANLDALDLCSFVCVPLVVRGRAIGALTVASCARVLDEHDLRVIEELARQAAAAIDNARLFAAEHQARERVSRLQELTAALSRAQTADDVVEVTCRIGSQAMEAISGVIWLADGAGGLVIASSWDAAPEFIEQFRVLAAGDDRFPAIDVVRTGVPAYVETAEDWKRLAPGVYPIARARGRLASFAALPMVTEAGIAGVIAFGHPLGHRYDTADRAFYTTLAQHCQQALERARLLDEARAASAAAYRASRAKDEFLAMLGHELRNPLAPIVTALDLLRHRGTPGFERERAVIDRQVQHLCRLVDDLLDISRITAGRIQLERAPIPLHDVVVRSVEMVRPLIEERGHELVVEVEGDLQVDGDATRLAQVVTNLLVNAAKYTPPGGRLAVLGARDGGEVVLRVRDTGAGISAELLPHVFDLFQQGPQALHRPHGGLGLGLAIVKNLVTLHGGTVSAHSEGPARGSELVVRLPDAGRR
jgi:PAS domain S-box-containing protein